MDVSIVVVTYNSQECIRECLESVLGQEGVELEVIAVDNASADGSARILEGLGDRIHLTLNHENLGFGRANNQAFPHCRGKYLYMLNPDACPRDGLLASMVDFMERHPKVGLAGTRIVEQGKDEWVRPGYRYPGEKYAAGRFADLPGRIAWVLGASMFARRSVLEEVGGFDPDYFLYAEEADLALRIRKAGYEIGLNEAAAVDHLGGHSERRASPYDVWRRKETSLTIFYEKHYGARTARKIVRATLAKALFRIPVLRVGCLFGRGPGARDKLERYRALRDVAREFLNRRRESIRAR